jgi:hypothetical protein
MKLEATKLAAAANNGQMIEPTLTTADEWLARVHQETAI